MKQSIVINSNFNSKTPAEAGDRWGSILALISSRNKVFFENLAVDIFTILAYTLIMKHGLQTILAQTVGLTPQTIHGLLSKTSTRHASLKVAQRLARVTGTDAEFWQNGGTGTPSARRAAIQAWAEKAN